MGFALWVDTDGGVVWAQGTHEYRPMGAAAVAVTDQFRHRDFDPTRRCRAGLDGSFAGFYASLEDLNAALRRGRRSKLRPAPGFMR